MILGAGNDDDEIDEIPISVSNVLDEAFGDMANEFDLLKIINFAKGKNPHEIMQGKIIADN